MNYIATDTQLTAIADAIRDKAGLLLPIKNLYDTSKASFNKMIGDNGLLIDDENGVVSDYIPVSEGWYTLSGITAYTNKQRRIYCYNSNKSPTTTYQTDYAPRTIGVQYKIHISIASTTSFIRFATGLNDENIQFEAGSTATEYEPYPTAPLVFPNEFVSAIDGITTIEETDGTATISDIKSGKTAWVNGSKLTGTYTPYVTFENAETEVSDVKLIIPAGAYEADDTVVCSYDKCFTHFVQSITSAGSYGMRGPQNVFVNNLVLDNAARTVSMHITEPSSGFNATGDPSYYMLLQTVEGVFYPATVV